MRCEWSDKIFQVTAENFEVLAIEIFHFQYKNNLVYREYVDALQVKPDRVTTILQTPFIPVGLFRNKQILCGNDYELVFESSRTTGTDASKHIIKDVSLYEKSFRLAFEQHFGKVSDWCILALLPSYLERNNASLVYMASKLIDWSENNLSGFYLDNFSALAASVKQLESKGQKTMLLGVSFALLDFARAHPMQLENTTIVETGGMKGRKKEIIREDLHDQLCKAFGVRSIASEYGMTELLSQAYSTRDGKFSTPSWMKILLRDMEDPLSIRMDGSGAINVIDLANVYSCSFIETQDAGELLDNNTFKITGRMDHSDVRGCSLMVVA